MNDKVKELTLLLIRKGYLTRLTFALIAVFVLVLVGGRDAVFENVKASGAPPTNGATEGDWIITDAEYRQDEYIWLNGDIIIQDDGVLSLTNVTFVFNCTYDGEFSIIVERGGSLWMRDSFLNWSEERGFSYGFIIKGTGDISNTYIEHVYDGITIESSDVRIMDSWVSNCDNYGIFCEGYSPIFESNTFFNCTMGVGFTSYNPTLTVKD